MNETDLDILIYCWFRVSANQRMNILACSDKISQHISNNCPC